MILKQLQSPSQHPAHSSAQAKMQYLTPLAQFSMALPVSPSLQSMQMGAHRVQQQASQNRQAKPQASQACHRSMQQATPQALQEQQQQLQHFFRKSINSTNYNLSRSFLITHKEYFRVGIQFIQNVFDRRHQLHLKHLENIPKSDRTICKTSSGNQGCAGKLEVFGSESLILAGGVFVSVHVFVVVVEDFVDDGFGHFGLVAVGVEVVDVVVVVVHEVGDGGVVHGVVAVGQIDFVAVDFEGLHAVDQFRVRVGTASHAQDFVIEVLQVLSQSLRSVSVGVAGHEDHLQLNVVAFWELPDDAQHSTQFNQGRGTDVGAFREPEVYQVVGSFQVVVSDGVAMHVDETPVPADQLFEPLALNDSRNAFIVADLLLLDSILGPNDCSEQTSDEHPHHNLPDH